MSDLVKAAPTAVSTTLSSKDEDAVSVRDIMIPSMLIMQPVSSFVHEDKAVAGEIRGSLEANLIAAKNQAADFICFKKFKTRLTFRKNQGKQEFIGQVPWEAAFETAPRSEYVDGLEQTHYEVLNFLVLRPEDIASGEDFPYLLSFRSTGYKAGKMLETYRVKLKMAGKAMSSKVFSIKNELVKNDLGSFYVPTISVSRDSSKDELAAVEKWANFLATADTNLDDSHLADNPFSEGAASNQAKPLSKTAKSAPANDSVDIPF